MSQLPERVDVMNSKYAPIVLFVYKREKHVQQVLDALDANILADQSSLFIFSDGYKDDTEKIEVEKVRDCIRQYKKNNHFQQVTIYEMDKHCGLANSVITGVTRIMNDYGRVIVLEDDLVTSKDFLMYMNDALDYYASEKSVWSIAGYSPNMKELSRYHKDVYVCMRASSTGWATWKDRWDSIDWDVKDYPQFVKDIKKREEFRKRGYNMPEMLDARMQGKVDSWAIIFCYEQFKQNKVTINPTVSKIKNIGYDGSGTHKENAKHWDVVLRQNVQKTDFIMPEIDKKIVRAYFFFHAGNSLQRFMKMIKYKLHVAFFYIRCKGIFSNYDKASE